MSNVEDPEVHAILEHIRRAGEGTIERWTLANPDAARAVQRLKGAARSVTRAHAGDPHEPVDPPEPPVDPPTAPPPVGPPDDGGNGQGPGIPYEDAIFSDGAPYGWLDDSELVLDGAKVVDTYTDMTYTGGWRSTELFQAPAGWSGTDEAPKVWLANNTKSPGGQYGPKWGGRPWNLTGTIKQVIMQRYGWWGPGGTGEGHNFYPDAIGDLTLEDWTAIQCGGQAFQIAQYANPTYSLFPFGNPAQFHNEDFLVTLRRCRSINCGVMHGKPLESGWHKPQGRGAWAFSYFNPGQSLLLEDCEVHTHHAVRFLDPNRGWCRSTGALICTPGKPSPIPGVSGAWGVPNLRLLNFKARLGKPDREDVRLVKVAAAQIIDLDLARVDDSGLPELSLFDDCGTIEVLNPKAPVAVQPRYTSTAKPKGPPIVLQPGEDRTFQMS